MDYKRCAGIAGVVACAAIPNVGGIINGIYCKNDIKTWYKTIKKPSFTPPDWVFGPVWTSLYTGVGYASYLVYKHGGGLNGRQKCSFRYH